MGAKNNAYRILVGRSEGKRPLGMPRSKCEDNIKINFKQLNVILWTGFISPRVATGGGLL